MGMENVTNCAVIMIMNVLRSRIILKRNRLRLREICLMRLRVRLLSYCTTSQLFDNKIKLIGVTYTSDFVYLISFKCE
jgi:hypothetical protein